MADFPWFPLFVNLAGKKIVVIGAGKIARRRILTLLDFTETVTVVAPEVHPDLQAAEAEGRLNVIRRAWLPEDLTGADLVLAATDDGKVNEAVRSECRRLTIPVNVSSDRRGNDFYVPGIGRKGELVVGVTAGGTDHAAARRITEAIRALLETVE